MSVRGEDDILVEEGQEGMQETSEHELVDILIKLVGEKFVESQARSRLISVHPGIRLFCLISKGSSDLSSDPF